MGSGPLFRRPWSLSLAPDGAVVVTDSETQGVYRVAPGDGARRRVYPAGDEATSRDSSPEGALLLGDGSLLLVDRRLGELVRVGRRGTRLLSAAGRKGDGPGLEAPIRLQRFSDGALAVLDPGSRSLVEIDPTTGARKVLSGPDRGKGPPFDEPDDLVILPGDRIFVADNFTGLVTRVDRETGDRSVALDVRRPPGPTVTRPFGLGAGGPDELLVCDPIIGTVLAVDLATGRRRVVTSPASGSGASCPQVFDALRLPGGDVVCSNPRGRALVRVDGRGRRSILSGLESPDVILEAVDNCVASDGRRTVVADALGGRLLEVDPRAGTFRVLSGPERGAGPVFRCPNEVALAGPDRALLVDWEQGLLEIDLATGDRRTALPADSPGVKQLFDVAVDPQGRTWLLDTRVPALFRLERGRLDLVSGPGRGAGPAFLYPGRLVASARGLLVTDMDSRTVLLVDPESGDRRVLTGPDRGAGEPFSMPEAVVELPGGDLLVSDVNRGRIVRVDGRGDRRVVAGPAVGAGPPLDAPEDMALGPEGTILVSDPGYGGLLVLDPRTGIRTLLRLRQGG